LRTNPNAPLDLENIKDPLLRESLRMLRLYLGRKKGWGQTKIIDEIGAMPENDFTAAAIEYMSRSMPEVLQHITQPKIKDFFEHYQEV
jgi:hypothetical protein